MGVPEGAQADSLAAWKREAHDMWAELLVNIRRQVTRKTRVTADSFLAGSVHGSGYRASNGSQRPAINNRGRWTDPGRG